VTHRHGHLAERPAWAPPEHRGLTRDGVRLLVAHPGGVTHTRFDLLPEQLRAGDLLVVNISATLPAALDVRRGDGRPAVLHVSTRLVADVWSVEVRDGAGPARDAWAGETLTLPDGSVLTLVAGYPDGRVGHGSRLWRAERVGPGRVRALLARHGRPIRYHYVPDPWPLEAYQTVFATCPGSAEMPSAARPFTAELVTRLVAAGVTLAPIVLHTGVSSPEVGEPPYPERFDVPGTTARLVSTTRSTGGRVVAVGTTVVRALETVATPDGLVHGGRGWTDLVLGPSRPARAVDGLISGLHPDGASHRQLLEAVVGAGVVSAAYIAAGQRDYLWHEFGDSMLLLPE